MAFKLINGQLVKDTGTAPTSWEIKQTWDSGTGIAENIGLNQYDYKASDGKIYRGTIGDKVNIEDYVKQGRSTDLNKMGIQTVSLQDSILGKSQGIGSNLADLSKGITSTTSLKDRLLQRQQTSDSLDIVNQGLPQPKTTTGVGLGENMISGVKITPTIVQPKSTTSGTSLKDKLLTQTGKSTGQVSVPGVSVPSKVGTPSQAGTTQQQTTSTPQVSTIDIQKDQTLNKINQLTEQNKTLTENYQKQQAAGLSQSSKLIEDQINKNNQDLVRYTETLRDLESKSEAQAKATLEAEMGFQDELSSYKQALLEDQLSQKIADEKVTLTQEASKLKQKANDIAFLTSWSNSFTRGGSSELALKDIQTTLETLPDQYQSKVVGLTNETNNSIREVWLTNMIQDRKNLAEYNTKVDKLKADLVNEIQSVNLKYAGENSKLLEMKVKALDSYTTNLYNSTKDMLKTNMELNQQTTTRINEIQKQQLETQVQGSNIMLALTGIKSADKLNTNEQVAFNNLLSSVDLTKSSTGKLVNSTGQDLLQGQVFRLTPQLTQQLISGDKATFDTIDKTTNAKDQIELFLKTLKENPSSWTNIAQSSGMTSLLMVLKEYYNLGVLTGNDEQLVTRIIGPITSSPEDQAKQLLKTGNPLDAIKQLTQGIVNSEQRAKERLLGELGAYFYAENFNKYNIPTKPVNFGGINILPEKTVKDKVTSVRDTILEPIQNIGGGFFNTLGKLPADVVDLVNTLNPLQSESEKQGVTNVSNQWRQFIDEAMKGNYDKDSTGAKVGTIAAYLVPIERVASGVSGINLAGKSFEVAKNLSSQIVKKSIPVVQGNSIISTLTKSPQLAKELVKKGVNKDFLLGVVSTYGTTELYNKVSSYLK